MPSVGYYNLKVTTNERQERSIDIGDEWRGENEIKLESANTSYIITQELPEGWTLNSVHCNLQKTDIPNGKSTAYTYGIENVTILPDQVTTCTFINTKKGSLEIIKRAEQAVGGEQFNYDVAFLSTDYEKPLILNISPLELLGAYCGDGYCNGNEDCDTCSQDCGTPITTSPLSCPSTPPAPVLGTCGNGRCGLDEDCNICGSDCGPCKPGNHLPPNPAHSPSRMTIDVSLSAGPPPPPPLLPQSINTTEKRLYPGKYNIAEYMQRTEVGLPQWVLNVVDCKIDGEKTTGTRIGDGIGYVRIVPGMKTICKFTNVLSAAKKGSTGREVTPEDEQKPGPPGEEIF